MASVVGSNLNGQAGGPVSDLIVTVELGSRFPVEMNMISEDN